MSEWKKMTIFAKIIRLLDSTAKEELRRLSQGIERLAVQRDEARAALRAAREEIADLRRETAALKESLRQRELDVEYLTVSRRLADNPQSLADARKTVRGMLAKVEKAIALLKEDARI